MIDHRTHGPLTSPGVGQRPLAVVRGSQGHYDAGMSQPPYAVAGGSVDQVVRLEGFRQRHPNVEITSPRQNQTRAWKAVWDTEHGYDEINRFDLGQLLSYLERKFEAEQDN